ncbi:hypothetical protein EDD95_8088 [Streptomyces sp. CEV 2-1]|nr:hypothetical protein EDD95_8088 [Streptomyces sp. CEV 2-1]
MCRIREHDQRPQLLDDVLGRQRPFLAEPFQHLLLPGARERCPPRRRRSRSARPAGSAPETGPASAAAPAARPCQVQGPDALQVDEHDRTVLVLAQDDQCRERRVDLTQLLGRQPLTRPGRAPPLQGFATGAAAAVRECPRACSCCGDRLQGGDCPQVHRADQAGRCRCRVERGPGLRIPTGWAGRSNSVGTSPAGGGMRVMGVVGDVPTRAPDGVALPVGAHPAGSLRASGADECETWRKAFHLLENALTCSFPTGSACGSAVGQCLGQR